MNVGKSLSERRGVDKGWFQYEDPLLAFFLRNKVSSVYAGKVNWRGTNTGDASKMLTACNVAFQVCCYQGCRSPWYACKTHKMQIWYLPNVLCSSFIITQVQPRIMQNDRPVACIIFYICRICIQSNCHSLKSMGSNKRLQWTGNLRDRLDWVSPS